MKLKFVTALILSLLVSSYALSSEDNKINLKNDAFEKASKAQELAVQNIIEMEKQAKNQISKDRKLFYSYLNQPINVFIYKVDFKKFPNDINHFNDLINKEGNTYNALSKEGNIVDANIITFPLTVFDSSRPNYYSIQNQKQYIFSSHKNSDGEISNEYKTAFGGIGFSAYLNIITDNKLSMKLSIKRQYLTIIPARGNSHIEVPEIIEHNISTDVNISQNRFTVVSVANQLEGNKNIFEFIVVEANPK